MGDTPATLKLGRLLDGDTEGQLALPRHQLTTHGVILGMTGSGKTGLGVVLLEEVLSSGVPVIVLDPKGDMGNLALTFPDLAPSDFRPWVDEGEALRKGITPDALAAETADRWRSGLAGSGIDSTRLADYKASTDVRVLTPGSSAGIALNILGDLSAPRQDEAIDDEDLNEAIENLVSGLLVLADLEADPLTSPEHILLSNLIGHAWRAGRDLDLATLLGEIQTPPFRRLGVFELDAFMPPAERMKLAMRLNGLMASPSFAAWLEGEPLDIESLLWDPKGRPRASVVYLAHLSESERQFVVTLLLSKVVTWMRQQPGTSDLRALVYVDEMFGLAPPTAEPPSKRPFLTLFKQARAHGLGVVVSTQNPMDLDYKLISNAGTWMVGRLQTERDKKRILEGLRSASGDVDSAEWGERIGSLGKREFLMKSTRSSHPVPFTSRWAMSYLRGPLTRAELKKLKEADGPAPAAAPSTGTAGHAAAPPQLASDESPFPPEVAAGTRVRYLDATAPWAASLDLDTGGRRMRLGAAARVHLLFDEAKASLNHREEWEAVLFPLEEDPQLSEALVVDYDARDFTDDAPDGIIYRLPGAPVRKASFIKSLERQFKEHLHRNRTVEIHRNRALKAYARVGESAEAFIQRCLAIAEDRADEEAAKLRGRVERKLATARRGKATAERRVRELEVDVGQRRQQELVGGASEVLSMFLGGRRRVRSLSGAASRRGQVRRTQERLKSAVEKQSDYEDAIIDLEDELADEISSIWDRWQSVAEDIETLDVGLEKTDIHLDELFLFWAPEA